MPIMKNVNDTKEVEEWIKLIGQAIIDRAKDVSNDMKHVSSISICAKITPDKVLNFDITKNYSVYFEKEEV